MQILSQSHVAQRSNGASHEGRAKSIHARRCAFFGIYPCEPFRHRKSCVHEKRQFRNRQQSPLLRLPQELRNAVYDLAASSTELQVGGEERHNKYSDAITLSKTCRQLYEEIQALRYNTVNLHIHDFAHLVKWLRLRAQKQLEAVTKLSVHITMFLHDAIDDENFRLDDRSLLSQPEFRTWRLLPNLKSACIFIHPYNGGPASLNPMLSKHKGVWDRRAQQIAEPYAVQLSNFHRNDDLRLTGEWTTPWSCRQLDEMKVCFDDGTLYADVDGVWRCSRPLCRLWDAGTSRRRRWWHT